MKRKSYYKKTNNSDFPYAWICVLLIIASLGSIAMLFDQSIGIDKFFFTTSMNTTSGKVTSTSKPVSAAIKAEAASVAQRVMNYKTDDSLVLFMASDIHILACPEAGSYDETREAITHMGEGMSELRNNITPDGIVLLGDYNYLIDSHKDYQENLDAMQYVVDAVEEATSGMTTVWLDGNHDYCETKGEFRITDEEHYSLIGANNSIDVVTDPGNEIRNYGYVDFESQRIRMIFLNTTDVSGGIESGNYITEIQYKWLVSTLYDLNQKSDAEDWAFLIVSHIPIYDSTMTSLQTTLAAYKDKTAGKVEYYSIKFEYDFTTAKAEFIGTIHGHNHNYGITDVETPNGNIIKAICIPNACPHSDKDLDGNRFSPTYKDVNDDAKDNSFNVIVIDRGNKLIHAINYGAGEDRLNISYAN